MPVESAATVLTCARASAVTLNVVLPVDAVAELVATTALDEDVAVVACHAVASVSAWAAVCTAVSLLLMAWYALSWFVLAVSWSLSWFCGTACAAISWLMSEVVSI